MTPIKSRELMKDSPELDVLLDRCMTNDYGVDRFDCFYMQGISERDKSRVPDFNPADGHWYGASVIVAGGLIQRAFRQAGYSDEALGINREIVEANVQHEIETLKGKPTRESALFSYSERKKMYLRLAEATEGQTPKDLIRNIATKFAEEVEEFRRLCEEGSSEVHDHVDFSSPVFANTQLFLPFKERRGFTEGELAKLASAHLHDLYPFTAHLMHMFYLGRRK